MAAGGLDARERRAVTALLVTTFLTATAALAGVTALGKQVFDLTHRPLDLGWLGLAEFAPAALLVLATGPVADRHDRRQVTCVASVGEAVVAAALALYTATGPTAVTPIFGLVVLFGVARAFAAPALRALPADVVGPDRLPYVVPRFSGSWQLALIAGPVLGGFLYTVDPSVPYWAMSALLLLGGLSALAIRRREEDAAAMPDSPLVAVAMEASDRPVPPTDGARPGLRDAFEGLSFIRSQPLVLGAISLDLFAVLFGGAAALLPAIAEDRLGVGAVGLGWLRAAGGIGAAITTFALAVHPLRRHVGRTLLFVVTLFGVSTVVLGSTREYAVAFAAMLVMSGADAISVFIRATIVPLLTPADRRGRVLAVENVFIGASNELGEFESGVLGQAIGPAGAVVAGGVATIVIAATWWRLFPALRDLDGFPAEGAVVRARG